MRSAAQLKENDYTIQQSTNVDRYPSKYFEITKNTYTLHTQCSNKDIDFGLFGENLTQIKPNYSIFIEHREEIIDLLNNDNYIGILKLIDQRLAMPNANSYMNSPSYVLCDDNDHDNYYDDNLSLTVGSRYKNGGFDIRDTDNRNEVSAVNTYQSKRKTYSALTKYCYFNKDVELLKILMLKNPNSSLFPLHNFENTAFNYENQYMFETFIENIKYDENEIANIIDNIIICNNNTTIYLDILRKYDYHISIGRMRDSIITNRIDIVQNAILFSDIEGNVQNAVDTLFVSDANVGHFSQHDFSCCSTQMLKCLLDGNINLKSSIDDILCNCIEIGNLDSVMFLIETFPGLDMNLALNIACKKDRIDILTYFLKRGVDINWILSGATLNVNVDTFKFLIESGYSAPQFELDVYLIRYFVNDDHLDNVTHLIKYGAGMKYLSAYENLQTEYKNYRGLKQYMISCNNWASVNSPLELIVTAGRLTHIKFMIDNYFDVIKPHINRLFIVACANGRNLIASYLLDYGAELSYKALVSACFFGHLETVVLLLKNGLKLDMCNENLFNMIINGKASTIYDFDRYVRLGVISSITPVLTFYHQLIENCDEFKNDIYHYGNDHAGILKLLISHDVKQLGNCALDIGCLTSEFYDICILKYFIVDDALANLDKKCVIANQFNSYETRSLLESAILYEKLDVIEYLLQNGAKGPVGNNDAVSKVLATEPIMNMLLKYGIVVEAISMEKPNNRYHMSPWNKSSIQF